MIDLYSIQSRLNRELGTLINLEDVVFVARQRGDLPTDNSTLSVLDECLSAEWLRPIADEINVIYENSIHRTYLYTYLQCSNEELNLRLVDLCKSRSMLSATGKPTDPYMGISATAAYIIQHYGVTENPQDISNVVLQNETWLTLVKNGRDRCIESKRVLPSVATHIALTKLARNQLGIQDYVTYFPLDMLTATAPTLYTGVEEQQSRFNYQVNQEPEAEPEQEPVEDAEFEEYTQQTTSGAGKVKNTSSFKDKAATAGRTVVQGSKNVARATASAGGKVVDFSAGAIRVAGKTSHAIRQTPQKVDDLFHSYETEEEREVRLAKKAEKKAEKERLDALAKERQIEVNAKLQEEEAAQETLRRQQKYERRNQRGTYPQGTSIYNNYGSGGFGYGNTQRRGLFRNNNYGGYGSSYGSYGSSYGGYGSQRRGLFNRGNRQPRQRASATTLLICGTLFLLALGYVLTLIIH